MDLHLLLTVSSLCFEALTEQLVVLHGNIWSALFCSTSQPDKYTKPSVVSELDCYMHTGNKPLGHTEKTSEINIKQHSESPHYQNHIHFQPHLCFNWNVLKENSGDLALHFYNIVRLMMNSVKKILISAAEPEILFLFPVKIIRLCHAGSS